MADTKIDHLLRDRRPLLPLKKGGREGSYEGHLKRLMCYKKQIYQKGVERRKLRSINERADGQGLTYFPSPSLRKYCRMPPSYGQG